MQSQNLQFCGFRVTGLTSLTAGDPSSNHDIAQKLSRGARRVPRTFIWGTRRILRALRPIHRREAQHIGGTVDATVAPIEGPDAPIADDGNAHRPARPPGRDARQPTRERTFNRASPRVADGHAKTGTA